MKTFLKVGTIFAAAIAATAVSAGECDVFGLNGESRLAKTELKSIEYELRAKRAELALMHPEHSEEIFGSAVSLPTLDYLIDAKIADEHAYPLTCDAKFLRAAQSQVGIARTAELVRLMKFDTTSEVVGR